jgi:putative addiction module killer protein
MIEIRRTALFALWLRSLRDQQARLKIFRRIDRLGKGNHGDVKSVGGGLSELRIDHGPGYRIDFFQSGSRIVVLLCGGDKSTQEKDIAKARDLMRNWQDDN